MYTHDVPTLFFGAAAVVPDVGKILAWIKVGEDLVLLEREVVLLEGAEVNLEACTCFFIWNVETTANNSLTLPESK